MNETKYSNPLVVGPFLSRRRIIFLITLPIIITLYFHQTREIEVSRTPDPTGKYVVIVSFQSWQKPFTTTPGNGGSHSGYVSIETMDGKDLGKANLSILWMADDMRWREDGATLVGSGIWDFKSEKFESWE